MDCVDLLFNIGTLQPLKRWSKTQAIVSGTLGDTLIIRQFDAYFLFCTLEGEEELQMAEEE